MRSFKKVNGKDCGMTVRYSRNKNVFMVFFSAIFFTILAAPISSAGQNEAKGKRPDALLHAELVGVADAWIAKQAPLAAADALRPIYHMRTQANWFNDPHGAVFYDGNYHIFMQHAVFQLATGMGRYYDDIPKTEQGIEYITGISGMKGWAHMVSKDLVYWEHWPTALVPSPRSYDRQGCWSGCSFIDDEGIPTIFYTGYPESPICVARSYDGMKTWIKDENNPLLMLGQYPERTFKNHPLITGGWRDPMVWKQDGEWLMLIGSRINGKDESGATALLYKSKDLKDWEYLNPLCLGYGRKGGIWECPNFFPLGDKYVLEVSIGGDWSNRYVMYSVGDYADYKFTLGQWHIMDWGMNQYLAPTTMLDCKGRRIIWGYLAVGGGRGYPWETVLSLPRVLTLRPDGRLNMKPLPELKVLRGKKHHFDAMTLVPGAANILADAKGDSLEIIAEFEIINATSFGIDLRRSSDGQDKITILYDVLHKTLINGVRQGSFQLLDNEDSLKLHIFLDKSIIEVYANERECITARHYPKDFDSLGLNLFAVGGSVEVKSLEIYEMNSIWK